MEYLENQFRRFTFFYETGSYENSSLFLQDNELISSPFEVINVEGYRKENQFFFIVDTLPNYDFSDIKKELKLVTEPLERIYEFNQKKVYTAKEGQLKTRLDKCKRFVWTLLLEEDEELIAEYKKVHSIRQAWPEITQNMKQVGVKDMEIYLYGNQAFLIMDTKPDFDLEKVGPIWQKLPRENEWQAYVAKFQRTNSESSIQEKWIDMEKINVNN